MAKRIDNKNNLRRYVEQNQRMPILTPWIDARYGMNAYEFYRRQNFMTVPSIAMREYSAREKKRTIHFKFADGTKAHDSIVQIARFGIVRDLIIDQERITDTEVVLSALPIPDVEHERDDVVVLPPNDHIPEAFFTIDSEDQEITIVFPLLGYEDDNDNTVIVETPEERPNDRPSIPDTLARIPIVVYIFSGLFILIGIILLIKGHKKEELEVI